MPLGAGFALAFVVLPVLLRSEVEDDVVALVLFCVVLASAFCPRRPMRVILLNMV